MLYEQCKHFISVKIKNCLRGFTQTSFIQPHTPLAFLQIIVITTDLYICFYKVYLYNVVYNSPRDIFNHKVKHDHRSGHVDREAVSDLISCCN